MTPCLSAGDVPGLAMLPPGDPERAAADRHAAECPRCSAALRDAALDLAPLDDIAAPPPSAESVASVRRSLTKALADDARAVAREGWGVLAWAGLALIVIFALFPVANRSVAAHVEGALAVVVAIVAALSASTTRRARVALGTILATSLSMIAFEVESGGAAPAHGAACSGMVGLVAIVPAMVSGWLAVRALEPGPGWRNAARAGAAALAAQGALALVCSEHGVLHLMPFHFLTLVTAVVIGAAVPWVVTRRAPV